MGVGLGCIGVIQVRIWFSLGIAAKAEGAEGEEGGNVGGCRCNFESVC